MNLKHCPALAQGDVGQHADRLEERPVLVVFVLRVGREGIRRERGGSTAVALRDSPPCHVLGNLFLSSPNSDPIIL